MEKTRKYYDRQAGLLDEHQQQQHSSRLFERIMLKENLLKIANDFVKNVTSDNYYINMPAAAEKRLYYYAIQSRSPVFEREKDTENFGALFTDSYAKADKVASKFENSAEKEQETLRFTYAATLVHGIQNILKAHYGKTKLAKWFMDPSNEKRMIQNLAGLPENAQKLADLEIYEPYDPERVLSNKRVAVGGSKMSTPGETFVVDEHDII